MSQFILITFSLLLWVACDPVSIHENENSQDNENSFVQCTPPLEGTANCEEEPSSQWPVPNLAEKLFIDGSIHTGTDWNGAPYIGVWGETFDFKMGNYPLSWAIALIHTSLLLESRGVHYSPNAILSVAIKESRLGCMNPIFPNDDGCFQIEDGTAYLELQRLFPNRFIATHAEIIQDEHFETSAISLVYYTLFSLGMFNLYSADPYVFFENHPDPQSAQKVISAAYNRGLWWEGLRNVFNNCSNREVTQCFLENGNPQRIAIDHATAIADYTTGLNAAPFFDTEITLNDLLDYWNKIKPLYPDANSETIRIQLTNSFNRERGNSATILFHTELVPILEDLIQTLPSIPTKGEVINAICGLGYLWTSPPCP